MSITVIRPLLEARLSSGLTGVQFAWQNVAFTPTQGTPWCEAFVLPGRPEDPTMGDGYNREVGVFQVTLRYPLGAGSNAIETKAEEARSLFPRGLNLTQGSVRLVVGGKPSLTPSRAEGAWLKLDVSVPYFVETQS